MKNLAGVVTCDMEIRRELLRARIQVVSLPNDQRGGEVPASIGGLLGPFRFVRAWYYWRVIGPMPLAIALMLYADPVGRDDIRVAGHCGCPPPEDPWVIWRNPTTGKRLATLQSLAEFKRLKTTWPEIYQKGMDEHEFVAAPQDVGKGFVESYDIDSEVGLRLFADMARAVA